MIRKRNGKNTRRIHVTRTGKRTVIVSAALLASLIIAGMVYGGASHRIPSAASGKVRLKKAQQEIALARGQLHDGDLVLRTGNDFTSLTLRQFSYRDKTYSHCGIVHMENGVPYVYHAIGGEDNPDAKLRRDTFKQFCNPAHNRGFGVYRYDLTDAGLLRLDSAVVTFYREKIPFDMQFDLGSDDRFYCAEFVYKALGKATGDLSYIPVSHIPGFSYVAIDNLFLNNHAAVICRVAYPQ